MFEGLCPLLTRLSGRVWVEICRDMWLIEQATIF